MRKLLIVALLLNAGFLFAIWQQLSVVAEVGGGAGGSPCETDQTKYSLDTNDDGGVDLSDFVYGLQWFFQGTEAPRVCLATDDLEARVAALEAQHPVDLNPVITGFTFVETNAQGYPEYDHNATGIRFVRLPGGSFDMGSPVSETGHITREGPVHTVSLSGFLIAKYEVTQAEYEAVMTSPPPGLSATPSFATGPNLPVERVSWDDLHLADGFLERTGLSLPSEAQWEYACRAGTPGPYAGTGNLDEMGWYGAGGGNSGDQTHDVGTKQANQFGLHDLHGNVVEWCEDVFKSDFYSDEVPGFDPLSTSGSTDRVVRGGFYLNGASSCRSAYRNFFDPGVRGSGLSFRPARPLP